MRWTTLLILPFLAGVAAQGPADEASSLRARRETRRVIQELNLKSQKRRMELLKQANPEVARMQKEAAERDKKTQEIVARLRKGELPEGQAQREMYPLVKPLVQSQMNSLNDRVAHLEKKIIFMKQVQKNPDLLIQRRIEVLLGKRKLDDEIIW